jgi:hypothetical protein
MPKSRREESEGFGLTMESSQSGKCKASWVAIHGKLCTFIPTILGIMSVLRYPDKVRGILNEGGSFAEQSGWHLPGFDTSDWESRSFGEGLPSPGLGIFVTTFELDFDDDLDIPMSFVFDDSTSGQGYRAYLFVNGNALPTL